jgi:hypothetical protein
MSLLPPVARRHAPSPSLSPSPSRPVAPRAAARRRRRVAIATRREPSPSRCCAFEPRALSLPRRSTVAVGLAP